VGSRLARALRLSTRVVQTRGFRVDPRAVALGLVFLLACEAEAPPRGPEATCTKACAARAPSCSARECARGCNLVLDRLVEREGGHVLACIARGRPSTPSCDDRAWARCAALTGPHVDGGPPAPPSGDSVDTFGD